jgi:inhibitor of KinA sporulation pathway (predicted exonuclease)
MAIIVMDLEWNQGFPATPEQKFNEILQIGAVRLETWDSEPEVFSQWVRPMYHRALHYRVRELVPVDKKLLRNAPNFFQVLSKFRAWCGEDAQFITWGTEDLRVFHENLDHYQLDKSWITKEYDLQKAYGYVCFDTNQQYSLKSAIEACELEAALTFHDASHDAMYTAMIGKWMLAKYQTLPDIAEIDRVFAQRAEEKRQALLAEAARLAAEAVEQGEPVATWDCGPFPTAIACASSREARLLLCPECNNKMYHINYFPVDGGKHFIAKARCSEHGTFFTLLTLRQEADQVSATARVFDSASDMNSVFKICSKYEEPAELERNEHRKPRHRNRGRRPQKT